MKEMLINFVEQSTFARSVVSHDSHLLPHHIDLGRGRGGGGGGGGWCQFSVFFSLAV